MKLRLLCAMFNALIQRFCYVFGVKAPTCFNFPFEKWNTGFIMLFGIKVLFSYRWVLQKWLIASNLAVTEVKTPSWRISGSHPPSV